MTTHDPALGRCLSEEQLDRYHAGELTEDDRAAARVHLEACGSCRRRSDVLVAEHRTGLDLLARCGAPPAGATPDRLPAPLERDAIAGYEILDEIGRGGQGLIYRALQRTTKREVALKVLREGRLASSSARRRFEREIELAASLSHPHLVTVFDSGETGDGRQYVAMDFVRGAPLGRWSAGRPLRDRLRLFAQVCHAVNHAHQHGVIHRDLKPSNILVSDERAEHLNEKRLDAVRSAQTGGERRSGPPGASSHVGSAASPKILDFGLARSLSVASDATLTQQDHVAGTLAYMSPEHARGTPQAVDTRSDVYALGVILYEMICGEFPYPVQGDTIAVLRHIAESPPAALAARNRDVDGELETIVRKALDKDPARRYQTAGDLGRDVEHYLAGEPIEARRDSGWYLLRKALRRHRVAVGVAAAFVLTIVGSTIALAVLYAQQIQLRAAAEASAEAARQSQRRAAQRFDEVRALARTFLFEFDPKIRHLPGSAPARKLLVENALTYLDRLSAEAEDDPGLGWELASAYLAIGDVQGDTASSNLDAPDAALASYDKAHAMLQALRARRPENPRTRASLQLVQNKRSDALAAARRLDEAFAANAEAMEIGEKLVQDHPGNRGFLDSLGDTHERRGNLLLRTGRRDEAFEQFRASQRINEELARDADPGDLWTRRDGAAVLTKLALIRSARGEKAEALETYREFLAIVEPLLAAHPANMVARRDVATGRQWVGILLSEMGQPGEAIPAFESSAELFEGLLRDEPDSSVARIDLVTTLTRMGEALLALGRREDARGVFERGADVIDAQRRQTPDRPDVLRLYGVALYKLHELHKAAAQEADSTPAMREQEWNAAIEWLTRARDVFVDMRERGLLGPGDAGVPDALTAEIQDAARQLADRPIEP